VYVGQALQVHIVSNISRFFCISPRMASIFSMDGCPLGVLDHVPVLSLGHGLVLVVGLRVHLGVFEDILDPRWRLDLKRASRATILFILHFDQYCFRKP
jgi:hypothetical protein